MSARHVTPRSPKRRIAAAVVTALLCAAPVPGDIGGCGQPVQALDVPKFFELRKIVDCRRCTECNLTTKACTSACGHEPPPVTTFPVDCYPLVHDGEVCLRALLYASCDDYASYVADESPTVPTECDFCPEDQR